MPSAGTITIVFKVEEHACLSSDVSFKALSVGLYRVGSDKLDKRSIDNRASESIIDNYR